MSQVGNTGQFEVADWRRQIDVAAQASIDGFALNFGRKDDSYEKQLDNAFQAASGTSFKLFFSFDYAGAYTGGGPWNASEVDALLSRYASHSSYFHQGSQPLVSTFEGIAQSSQWKDLKQKYNCFFIPSCKFSLL
jgi:hypothetical protein